MNQLEKKTTKLNNNLENLIFKMKKLLVLFVVLNFMVGCESFLETDISDEEVVILSPVDGVILEAGTITFYWESISDADEYKVQMVTPSFDNATNTIIDTITEENTFTQELSSGTYEWRVKAINPGHETAYTSAILVIN